MRTVRILQTVALMLIVALAASCAATKEYASKIFPSKQDEKDSQAVALRFLDLDKLEPDQENWVTTDIIMGRDTGNKTAALDKLSETFPATGVTKKDTLAQDIQQTTPVYVNTIPVSSSKTEKKTPDVKNNSSASVKKTSTVKEEKTQPVIITEKKAEPVPDVPVARNYNTGDIREKKTREDNP